ncbi:PhoX family protein [Algoriphagus namhaensis]
MKKILSISLLSAIALTSCSEDGNKDTPALSMIKLENHSVTPDFLTAKAGFESVEKFSLFGSADTFEDTPNFIFGGSADGAGLIKEGSNYQFFVNNEDNFAVARITMDETFKPVAGAYVLNSDGAGTRMCSATMATPEEHGFGPVFLTAGESGPESQIQGVFANADALDAAVPRPLAALGRWNAENALPLHKTAYPNNTVILIGDDDSGTYGGQVAMYVGKPGDLNNGKVYVLRRVDQNPTEMDVVEGTTYDVEFVEIPNANTNTGAQNNELSQQLKSIAFGRVEDLDYRKSPNGSPAAYREIYFNVTGQNNSGNNADYSRSKYGRVYKLVMDDRDPLKGKLEVILDGDNRNGKAKTFQNPDNITVTENFIYVKEDPNGYGDETHDAYIYQYNIATKDLKVAFELDHRRSEGIYSAPDSRLGGWEYGAMIDISETIGEPNTFMLCIQPHTWRDDKFKGVDGGTRRPNENQGSQIVVLRGLAK